MILPVEKQPIVLGWFLVIYLVLVILIFVSDKRTDFDSVLSIAFLATVLLILLLFLYCFFFEFK